MTDRPLSVYDVFAPSPRGKQHPALGDHWYWCRKCSRPEHCNWAMVGCIRVGPFMDTAEATECGEGLKRADARRLYESAQHVDPWPTSALGAILRQEAEASVALDKGDGQTFVVDEGYARTAKPSEVERTGDDKAAWDAHQKCIQRWARLSDEARAGTTFHGPEAHL